jgi:hypothetical protein
MGLCCHGLCECLFAVSSPTVAEQIHIALVWWHAGSMDIGDVVLSNRFIFGLPVRSPYERPSKAQRASDSALDRACSCVDKRLGQSANPPFVIAAHWNRK